MNRPRTLAVVLLAVAVAALPTVAPAQSLKDFHDASLRTSSTTPTGDWGAYSVRGWRAIGKGYYDTAEHEFYSAIKAATQPGFNNPEVVARSYADYAWALQKQGRNAQAEPLVKWALQVVEASLEPNVPAIARNLNQLATLYYDLGRYPEAESLLRRAIETQSKSPKAKPREHARSQSLMGLLLAAQRRYAESEPYFRKAVTLREKAQGPSSPDTADALGNLAWAYHDQGKDDQAKPLFERALGIIERSRGELDFSVAHLVDGLGQILAKQGKADEAEGYFLRAIAIWEQFPDEGVSLLEVLRRYADLLEEKGRSTDLDKVKARIAPLRAKFTLAQARVGRWYRFPEPWDGLAPTSSPAPAPAPSRIPG
jgi:tetratricopeptide (TPR) repeat protein